MVLVLPRADHGDRVVVTGPTPARPSESRSAAHRRLHGQAASTTPQNIVRNGPSGRHVGRVTLPTGICSGGLDQDAAVLKRHTQVNNTKEFASRTISPTRCLTSLVMVAQVSWSMLGAVMVDSRYVGSHSLAA